MDSRLTHVEQNQTDDRTQLAQLNQQLEQQVAALKSQLARTQEGTRRGLKTLDAQLAKTSKDCRISAKSSTGKSDLRGTHEGPHRDCSWNFPDHPEDQYQPSTFPGLTSSLAAEGRTLWLDNLSVEESLDLFPRGAIRPYSLVITYIAANEVAGYLLLPAGAAEEKYSGIPKYKLRGVGLAEPFRPAAGDDERLQALPLLRISFRHAKGGGGLSPYFIPKPKIDARAKSLLWSTMMLPKEGANDHGYH